MSYFLGGVGIFCRICDAFCSLYALIVTCMLLPGTCSCVRAYMRTKGHRRPLSPVYVRICAAYTTVYAAAQCKQLHNAYAILNTKQGTISYKS